MWSACRSLREPPLLQMHTTVDQPLTTLSHGRISCRPIGAEPITFEWTGPNGADVRVDTTGSEAWDVSPGRYRVIATDANGARADVSLDVEPMLPTAMFVQEYKVTPASSGTARDGVVEAIGVGLDMGGRFLWTHGTETSGPVLRDVPCGTYAVTPLPLVGATVPTLVHTCPPARVTVASWDRS